VIAISAAPIESRALGGFLRDESHPPMCVTKRALQRTAFAGIRRFHCTFRNRNFTTTINVPSIRRSPVRTRIAIGRDNTGISGCNLRASTISGNAVSANTTPRTANRTTDEQCHKARNQRISGLSRAHPVEPLSGGDDEDRATDMPPPCADLLPYDRQKSNA
jgi:hypothetical protein